MSNINEAKLAPPPPPPPTLLRPQQESKLSPRSLSTRTVTKVDESDVEVSINRLLSSEGDVNSVFYKCNTRVTPQLQDGPKCGLVALSIATSVCEKIVSVDDIFHTAVSEGLTRQGEMFSAYSLALLAEKCCGFRARVINGGLDGHLHCIIESLMRNCLLLVPYDADFNHAPCCKKGTKAHWAVITGFIILQGRNPAAYENNNNFVKIQSKDLAPCNCPLRNKKVPLNISLQEDGIIIGKQFFKEAHKDIQEGKVYLIGLQGKSQHIGLWLFDEMAKSNNNLFFFSTNRDANYYVLPEGGLEEGLKGKAIVLDCC